MDRRTYLQTGVSAASVFVAIAGCLGNSEQAVSSSTDPSQGEAGRDATDRMTGDDTDSVTDEWTMFEYFDDEAIERIEPLEIEADADGREMIDERDHDGVNGIWFVNESNSTFEATLTIYQEDETVLEGSVSVPVDAALEVILAEKATYTTTVTAESAGSRTKTTTTATPSPSCAVSRTVLSFGDGGRVGTRSESRC